MINSENAIIGKGALRQMKKLLAKLRSRRGASLVIAVVFAVLALTVGTVMISGAATAKLIAARSGNTELYFNAVDSAARMLRDGIEGARLLVRFTRADESAVWEYNSCDAYGVQSGIADLIEGVVGSYYLVGGTESFGAVTIDFPSDLPAYTEEQREALADGLRVRAELSADINGGISAVVTGGSGDIVPLNISVPAALYAGSEKVSGDGLSMERLYIYGSGTISR